MDANKAMDWIRLLFAQIDKVIYWLISVTYSIIVKLSNISIFNSENIENFAGRVYAFLGIIMLFKVTFSLITYLIDPDAISDKTKGTGNLIKNIIITLFLIIIVPYGFNLLYKGQSAIINDNLIPKLILGTTDSDTTYLTVNMDKDVCGTDLTVIDTYGDYLATVTMRPFLQVYSDDKASLISTLERNFPDAKQDYCIKPVHSKLSKAVMYADTNTFNQGQYIFDYSFFVSTAFGILIFLLLLNFCFDIAVRTIKLGFLEIVAPIPIISYIDPKAGKDGILKKWSKEVLNTWLSLFIRLAAIYFAVYIIEIINTNVDAINEENGSIIILFLVIGALMFAKQAPGLIENIFGIKFNHTVQLNPFKKISDQSLGGKQLVSLPGKAVSTGVGLGLAAGGSIAGHRLKTQKVREGKQNLSAEEKRLERLKTEMKSKIGNYKAQELNLGSPYDPDFDEKKKKLKEARSEAVRSGYAVKEQQNKVNKAKENLVTAEEKYKKANSDNEENLYFSESHPVLSTVLQTLSGAKVGFDAKDTANIAKAITSGIEAAKKATKLRNDYDKFGFLDRLRDLGTDLSGVKNASGTTSIVREKMKEQTECLNNIKNAISSLEHTFGNLKPGAIMYDQSGKITINETGNYHYEVGEKENIQSLIQQYTTLRESEKATTKQIKEYEDVLAINKPPAK